MTRTQVARFAFEGGTITTLKIKIKRRVLSGLPVAVDFSVPCPFPTSIQAKVITYQESGKAFLRKTSWHILLSSQFLEKLLFSRAGLKTVGTAAFRLLRCIARELVDDGVASGMNHLKPRWPGPNRKLSVELLNFKRGLRGLWVKVGEMLLVWLQHWSCGVNKCHICRMQNSTTNR